MSFADRLVLWLHLAFAIFTIGPVALAISSTPRYIRRREVPILRYLSRITVIFTAASLLVLVFGVVLAQIDHDFAHPWLTVAMTLFVVAIVLLVLIIRDQRRAIKALATAPPPPAASGPADAAPADAPPTAAGAGPGTGAATAGDVPGPSAAAGPGVPAAAEAPGSGGQPAADTAALAAHVASVERGRIAALGGVVNLIWLVILVLMVWRP
jgi:cbb3-type cytochrome oxidase subunit 3